jgi:nitrite reductase/ring-hydroxylating ferredoxin subunit
MKNVIYIVLILFLTFSCSDNKTVNNNNPNLPNYTFSIDINTVLPLYDNLQFAGNSYLITQQGAGIRGVIVFNTGSGYVAYEAACPNQPLSNCSTMTISGIDAKCPCDDKKYNLYTGLSSGQQYPLKAYRTEVVEKIVRVYN